MYEYRFSLFKINFLLLVALGIDHILALKNRIVSTVCVRKHNLWTGWIVKVLQIKFLHFWFIWALKWSSWRLNFFQTLHFEIIYRLKKTIIIPVTWKYYKHDMRTQIKFVHILYYAWCCNFMSAFIENEWINGCSWKCFGIEFVISETVQTQKFSC